METQYDEAAIDGLDVAFEHKVDCDRVRTLWRIESVRERPTTLDSDDVSPIRIVDYYTDPELAHARIRRLAQQGAEPIEVFAYTMDRRASLVDSGDDSGNRTISVSASLFGS